MLHQIGQYFSWSIPRARRFKFVQIKSLDLCMAPPQGLKLLHSNIYRKMLKKYSSQEPLGQFQPNLAGNMLGGWEFRLI